MSATLDPQTRRRNRRTALVGAGIVATMVGVVAVSPTLYQVFCQVTGYGGTTQRSDSASQTVLDRTITVRFDANTDPGLPWAFHPKQTAMTVQVGETGVAYYESRNRADRPITGMATFNVTPLKAGIYFQKVHCFCFDEQTLAPGERVDMPVQFFVDPEIAADENMDDVQTITLSYTFFAQDDPEPDATSRQTADLKGGGDGTSGQTRTEPSATPNPNNNPTGTSPED